jgi:hypothetical protein
LWLGRWSEIGEESPYKGQTPRSWPSVANLTFSSYTGIGNVLRRGKESNKSVFGMSRRRYPPRRGRVAKKAHRESECTWSRRNQTNGNSVRASAQIPWRQRQLGGRVQVHSRTELGDLLGQEPITIQRHTRREFFYPFSALSAGVPSSLRANIFRNSAHSWTSSSADDIR